ncbi:MAG: mechanosensitive ion channel [Crocinitomicaceae bacterium]|nr:mechanosensitive ion channel [Crocinitomicaceae bacterium]
MEKETELLFGYTQSEIIDLIISVGINLLIAIVILFVGFKLAGIISHSLGKILEKRNSDIGLVTFLKSFIAIVIKLLTIITVFTQLGVEMTSFVAILGAAGFAIGMAFSGTLSNLAGGVMILLFKPFKVEDFIEAQGETGIVKEIQIFHTIMNTSDNKTIIIPNGPLSNGNITNYTMQEIRRVDFSFGFAYGEDYQLAKKVLMDLYLNHPKVLKDPEPFIGLGELADSSVNVTVRLWTKVEDYWEVYFFMNEKVYEKFNETEGLSIPFPQMDVHVDQVK